MNGFDVDPGWLWLIGGVVLLIAEVIAPGLLPRLHRRGGASRPGSPRCSSGSALAAAARDCSRIYACRRGAWPAARFYANRASDSSADPLLNDPAARLLGEGRDVVSHDEHSAAVHASATANGARAAVPRRRRARSDHRR